jgi:hypothetical protein
VYACFGIFIVSPFMVTAILYVTRGRRNIGGSSNSYRKYWVLFLNSLRLSYEALVVIAPIDRVLGGNLGLSLSA